MIGMIKKIKNQKILLLIAGVLAVIGQIIFLQPTDSIYILMICLYWLVIGWILKLNEKIFFTMALFLLIIVPIPLILGSELWSNKIAVWQYLFMVFGLVGWLTKETINFFNNHKKAWRNLRMVLYIAVITAFFLVFRAWFGFGPITSGDMGFFYYQQIKQYLNLPFAWETFREAGLGGNSLLFQGVYLYNLPMGFFGQFLDYGLIERLIWFWPILIVGLISPFLLAKELNLFPSKFYPLSSLVFFINTYFLMIIGGGQLTVALAYILIPLVFTLFLRASKEADLKKIIFFSLSLIFLVAWDFRFVYLMGIILSLYLFYFLPETVRNIRKYLKIFLIAGLFVLGLHAFWLLPFIINFSNPVASFTSDYTTAAAVEFLSFADFSHSFSLLHPNWPENIFGKTYLMQWQFLALPILAFTSLLFVNSKINPSTSVRAKIQINNGRMVLFFALLGLIGAFLAKGSQEPFGGIYLWMFAHIPGFVMFRDPTKFYTLTALSYSILIPYSIWKIYESLKNIIKFSIFNFQNFFLLVVIPYLLFFIKPAISGQLNGAFKQKEVPKEYVQLKNFIANQPEFFRTFWIPTKQRFAFYTDNHPGINGVEFLKVASASGIINRLTEKDSQSRLSLAGVKYVILPLDTEGEIFLKDRIRDEIQRQNLEQELNKIPWLRKIQFVNSNNQNKTIVYETPKFNDRFWLETSAAKLEWKMINPTKYLVTIKDLSEPTSLVFSENFNKDWVAKAGNKEISSELVFETLNSFRLNKTGNYEVIVRYKPQRYMETGLMISGVTLFVILVIFLFPKLEKKLYN